MLTLPSDLQQRYKKYNQDHVFTWWDQLSDAQRTELLEQTQSIDLEQLRHLFTQREATLSIPAFSRIAPIPVIRLGTDETEARVMGEEALRRGEVAALVVAGGQGSRLGFEHPKGMYEIGPVSDKSLFQIHAEKVLGYSRRYGKPIPFLVMTSPINHLETKDYFQKHSNFGIPASDVHFFSQGTMPALDIKTGRLILEQPGRLFTSPNGHGGSLTALAESGLLAQLSSQGIKQVFYFQVDNPLVKIVDPVFIGRHRLAKAEVSTKVVAKIGPMDKMGNLALIGGRCNIIEYSDLPESMAKQTDEQGRLKFWVGNPAIHIFDLDFLGRVTQGHTRIPFHLARKKVPYLDEKGQLIKPDKENALKFEMFIFDVLPRADRWSVVETPRNEEFEPLKNATGSDSPQSVRQAISNLAAAWLTKAGVTVPRQPDGNAAVPLEISPLYALDAEELAAKVDRKLKITGPTYLS